MYAHELQTWPHCRQSLFFWRWVVGIVVGFFAVLIGWVVSRSLDWTTFVFGSAMAAATAAAYPRYVRERYMTDSIARLYPEHNMPFLTGERSIEVTDDGLRLQSAAGEHLIRWAFVRDVEESSTHLFVRYRYGLGLPIPKQALDPGVSATLLNEMRARLLVQSRLS